MAKKIMFALSNAEGDSDKPIHCQDLDKNMKQNIKDILLV